MYRIILMVVRLFYKVPYYLIRIWWLGTRKNFDLEKNYAFIKKVTKAANRAGRVTIESYGVENIPKENGFIFFPNHQGMFDALVFLESCPVPFSVVYKKEVSNVILLKQVFRALHAIAIDREDIKQSLQVINQMTEEVKQGRNFLIFPEGTRNKSEDPADLMEFHEGSLKIAEKSGCPVIPVAITGTDDVFERHIPWIRKSHVIIEYGEPIYLKELPLDKKKFPGAYTREIISEMIKKQQQERAGK